MAYIGSLNLHSGQSSRNKVVGRSGTKQSTDKLSVTDTGHSRFQSDEHLPPDHLSEPTQNISERENTIGSIRIQKQTWQGPAGVCRVGGDSGGSSF